MLLRILILLLFFLGGSVASYSQDNLDIPPEITASTDGFFGRIQDHDTAGAWHFLWDGIENGISPQSLQSGIAETDANIKTYGNIYKWSLIDKKSIEDSTFRVRYYVRLRDIPWFVTFIYYKVNDKWNIINISMSSASDASKAGMFDIK